MIEISDEIILKINDLLNDWAFKSVEIVIAIRQEKEMPDKYADDDILVEYYNGLKENKDFANLRKNCELKYVRRGLKQLQITE